MKALLFAALIGGLIVGLPQAVQADPQQASVVDQNDVRFTIMINDSDFAVGDTLQIRLAVFNEGDEYVRYAYWVMCRYTIQSLIFEGECDWQEENCPTDWEVSFMSWPPITGVCNHIFEPGEADTSEPFLFTFPPDFPINTYTVVKGLTDTPGPLSRDDFLDDTVASLQFNYWGEATGVAESQTRPMSWGTIKALYRAH